MKKENILLAIVAGAAAAVIGGLILDKLRAKKTYNDKAAVLGVRG